MHCAKSSKHCSCLFLLISLHLTFITIVSSSLKPEKIKNVVPPNYAISPLAAKELAMTEEKIVTTLTKLLDAQTKVLMDGGQECYNNLSTYLQKYNQDTDAVHGNMGMERAESVVENGLLTFKMIHRLVSNLLSTTKESVCRAVNITIEDIFVTENIPKPSMNDLNEALLGILRIQFIYGFDAKTQMRLGIFGKTDTKAKLDFDNCYSFAQKAISMEAYVLAYQWLSAAGELIHSSEQSTVIATAWTKLRTLTNLTNLEDVHAFFDGKREVTLKTLEPYNYTDYASCREETVNVLFPQGDLFCFYHDSWDPYLLISPIKTEVLSESPIVIQFHEVFNEKDIEFLKQSTTNEVERTGVQPGDGDQLNEAEYGDFVTSIDFQLNSSVYGENTPIILRKLNRKIEMVTGLLVQKKWASQTQIMMYGALGGHYDIHYDSLQGSNSDLSNSGDRIATFLINLANVKMGGNTAFPHLGAYAKPLKGSAILWFNVLRNGKTDYRSMHTGCPVILGTKHVVRRGIFEYANIWNYRCSLNQYQ